MKKKRKRSDMWPSSYVFTSTPLIRSSKRRANAFKIHALIGRCLLDRVNGV